MKLLSFQGEQGGSWGVLTGAGVVRREWLGEALPTTLAGFVAACERSPGLPGAVLGRAEAAAGHAVALGSLRLPPCIPQPGKVICLGVNYVDHAKEGGNTVADYPALFLRCSTSLLAHGAPLKVPAVSSKLDFEAELAVVIGRMSRRRPRPATSSVTRHRRTSPTGPSRAARASSPAPSPSTPSPRSGHTSRPRSTRMT